MFIRSFFFLLLWVSFFSKSSFAGFVEVGGGAGAQQAYSYFLKGSVPVSPESDFGLRFSESGSPGSVSREFASSLRGTVSEAVRLGGEVYYRMDPSSVSTLGFSPGASIKLSKKTSLEPGVELSRISQPIGGGSGGGGHGRARSLVIYEASASLGLSQELTDLWSAFVSGAYYYYSAPTQGFNFSSRRRPLFTSASGTLGSFPLYDLGLSTTYTLHPDWDVSVGITDSEDSGTSVITFSKWIGVDYRINEAWGAGLQATYSNTGTQFYSTSLSYWF